MNADRLLTMLTIIFCILVVAVVCFPTYLSTGGVIDKPKWKVSTGTSATSSSSEASSTAEQPAANTTESSERTLTVQPGEGEAAIAARAGISIAELEQLTLLICPLDLGMPIQVTL